MILRLYSYALLFGFILFNITIYANIIPLYHEEPRRALVAYEMLLSKNFIVPTILQETYLKKPPFHNVLIALTSLGDKYISNVEARLPSILSYILLCISIFFTPVSKREGITASIYLLLSYSFLFSYGFKAEPDMLFTTLIFLSFLFYIKKDRLVYLFISSLFMSLSILTKGISVLFFYPPMLFYIIYYEKNKTKNLKLLLMHFMLSLLLPAVWLVLLSFHTNLTALIKTSYNEIFLRGTIDYKNYIVHLLIFPFRAIMATVPISLLFIFAFKKQNIKKDKLYRCSILFFLWIFFLIWLYPSGRGRYFLPAIPFFCILATYHVDTEKYFNLTLRKAILIIFAVLLIIGIPFDLYNQFYIQALAFMLTLIFILYYYNKPALPLLKETILLVSIYVVIFFHGPFLYKTKAYYNYDKHFTHVVNKWNNNKLPIYFDNTTKDDLKLAFFVTRTTQQHIGVLHNEKRNKYYLVSYKNYTNCSVLDRIDYKPKPRKSLHNTLTIYQCN